ncbi:FMN-binding negative transcriptional regulator [Amycolatopsis jejuensis]|uniref:FMN-binding negative transcriptional regulator n=1 Tax=Amycolatopsis jejuensis TaxID=330084 RepID=UPI00052469B6|nr:FMN-binding negative transcriptional regulator [Amycolatopsis jejuensis]
MRHNPAYETDDVRQLIRDYPFVTLVSTTSTGIVASHYPVLLDETAPGIVLVGHVGRPDEELHELGEHDVLVIVQGAHGYVSPSWYDHAGPAVPTWNFTVAHLHGRPELLSPQENFRELSRLVDHFEDGVACPRRVHSGAADAEYAQRIQHGTVGFRIPVQRIEAKAKLSQDKPPQTAKSVIAALETDGRYGNPDLARAMRTAYAGRASAK